jgi:hypothetical protein
MLVKRKEPKKTPFEVADNFFRHPLTEKILDVVAEISNDDLVHYYKNIIKPLFSMAKTLAIKSSVGLWTDEDGEALFTTVRARQLLGRLKMALEGEEN